MISRQTRRRLKVENLESRRLLAAELLQTSSSGDSDLQPNALMSQLESEGEPAADLVQFAKDLAAADVKFFSASWCADCTAQAQLFEDGSDDLPFVKVTGSDREFDETGIAEQLTELPTWEFPDHTRASGILSLQTISQRSGVDIPAGDRTDV